MACITRIILTNDRFNQACAYVGLSTDAMFSYNNAEGGTVDVSTGWYSGFFEVLRPVGHQTNFKLW